MLQLVGFSCVFVLVLLILMTRDDSYLVSRLVSVEHLYETVPVILRYKGRIVQLMCCAYTWQAPEAVDTWSDLSWFYSKAVEKYCKAGCS